MLTTMNLWKKAQAKHNCTVAVIGGTHLLRPVVHLEYRGVNIEALNITAQVDADSSSF